jgi:hypothetical protein
MKADFNKKQMGDAGEMLVAAEMTLAGVPTFLAPSNWPTYDLIGESKDFLAPQRISVQTRTFMPGASQNVDYCKELKNNFDWLAIVLLDCSGEMKRRFFIVPKAIADEIFDSGRIGTKNEGWKFLQVDKMDKKLQKFEDNFDLSPIGHTNQKV